MSEVKDQTLFTELLNIVSASKQNGVFLVREISDALASMGYRKVTECGKCECWWITSASPDGVRHLCRNGRSSWHNWMRQPTDYCSEGEPKEGVND